MFLRFLFLVVITLPFMQSFDMVSSTKVDV